MLYLTEAEVRDLLPMKEAIRLMAETFEGLRAGTAQNQPRRRLILPTGSVLHSLAGATSKYFGTKFYSTNPKHGAHFLFALYDAATALPLALMEANYLGQIRTGAASGYVTDLLAEANAERLGVVGSGFQARSQIDAIRAVRPISSVKVWSRNEAKRNKLAEEAQVIAVSSAEEAVAGAQIVVTATNAREPVIQDEWIGSGVHVNAMGSNVANRRELPGELVKRARLIAVDALDQARIEAGDLIIPDCWSNVVEVKNVEPGFDPAHVTIFKSIGLGVEDVAAGGYVYEEAVRKRIGRELRYS